MEQNKASLRKKEVAAFAAFDTLKWNHLIGFYQNQIFCIIYAD